MDGQSAQPGITIKKLTRSEAEAWEASHRGEEPAELASLDLDHSIAAAPDVNPIRRSAEAAASSPFLLVIRTSPC